MDNPNVIMALLGVSTIFFIVCAALSFKVWSVGHAVTVIFLFLTLPVAFIMVTQSLVANNEWWTKAISYEEKIDQAKKVIAEEEERHLELKREVEIAQLAVGRRWQECQRAATTEEAVGDTTFDGIFDSATGLVEIAINDPGPNLLRVEDNSNATAPTDPKLHTTQVFVFDAAPYSDKGRYLGEFIVVAARQESLVEVEVEGKKQQKLVYKSAIPLTEAQRFKLEESQGSHVVLQAMFPLTKRQQDQLQASSENWILYDEMPRELPNALTDLSEDQLKELLPDQNDPAYFSSDEQYQQYLDRYLYDGKEPTDQQKSEEPENVFKKVKFLQPHQFVKETLYRIEYFTGEKKSFTLNGAIREIKTNQQVRTKIDVFEMKDGQFLKPDEIKKLEDKQYLDLEEGDEMDLNQEVAAQLEKDQIIEILGDIFHRPADDYAQVLRRLNENRIKREKKTASLAGSIKISDESGQDLLEMIHARSEFSAENLAKVTALVEDLKNGKSIVENFKLGDKDPRPESAVHAAIGLALDTKRFETEAKIAQDFLDKLEDNTAKLTADRKSQYKQNNANEKELRKLERQAAEKAINKNFPTRKAPTKTARRRGKAA